MKDNRPFLGLRDPKEPLTALCDNVLASRLAQAWEATGKDTRVGDSIDRGLILLRELNEHGFDVIVRLPTGPGDPNA